MVFRGKKELILKILHVVHYILKIEWDSLRGRKYLMTSGEWKKFRKSLAISSEISLGNLYKKCFVTIECGTVFWIISRLRILRLL